MPKDIGELIFFKSKNLYCQPIFSYISSFVIALYAPFSQSLSHILLCLWNKKMFESYFSDRLTFSNIRGRTSCQIYSLAIPLLSPETLSSLSKLRILLFNAHLALFVRRMILPLLPSSFCHSESLTLLSHHCCRLLGHFFIPSSASHSFTSTSRAIKAAMKNNNKR